MTGTALITVDPYLSIWSFNAGHGPTGSLVVSVSVTPPAAISAAEGV